MDKNNIRRQIKEEKSKLSKEYLLEESQLIIKKVKNHPAYIESKIVYTYVSFNQEVITHEFIKEAFNDGKIVAIPKVSHGELAFIYIESLDFLKVSGMGILEPQEGLIAKPDIPYGRKETDKTIGTDPILVLVPGFAFDRNKNRLGYGKGYYDKFFSKYSHVPMTKLAITFDFQIVDEIPVTPYDVKMDEIITQSFHII